MRDITYKAVRAFMDGEPFKLANTEIVIEKDGSKAMYLHGHCIALITKENDLYITSAGWETSTTKERLNGIPNVHVQQKAGQWYLNGEKWENTSKFTKVCVHSFSYLGANTDHGEQLEECDCGAKRDASGVIFRD